MSIQIQPTPNPNAHKYTAAGLRFTGPINASTPEEADQHPLAARLFALENVYNVFLVQNFVTVNKVAEAEWEEVDGQVVPMIKEFLEGR
ncbi:MAG: NifU N-terminal domain-containing protein [Caldilineaceae bacterium]|nr:NifU N-terminal domain-containing protein [Caldilineaceae bacterium]